MTFEEWYGTEDFEYDSELASAAWTNGAASRDAEVAELKKQLADNNLFDSDRNQWRNNYRSTISDITNELDQLREHVTLLRDELNTIYKLVPDLVALMKPSALAATEPK